MTAQPALSTALGFQPASGRRAADARFVARGRDTSLLLTRSGAVQAVRGADGGASVVRTRFVGSDPRALRGEEPLPTRTSSFLGPDPSTWRRDVPSYGRVRYADLYPGIDLVYRLTGPSPEYDLVLSPHGSLGDVAMAFAPWRPGLTPTGDLVLSLRGERLRWRAPVSFQERDGRRVPVTSAFELLPQGRVGFRLGAHDPALPVVIDPTFVFSTYLGGLGNDEGDGIAVDASGAVYQTGTTFSADFPTTAGAYDTTYQGGKDDAFVAKYDPTTDQVSWVTFLGGTSTERGRDVALDASGNVFVAGHTRSADFPTTQGTFQTTFGGTQDAFLLKLSPGGDQLLWSSLLGGNKADWKPNMTTDAFGNPYITGFTFSHNFPLLAAYQSDHKSGADVFVTELNGADGTGVFSTFLGGSGSEAGRGIGVDVTGVYVTGFTESPNFPTEGGFDTELSGDRDAFITKFPLGGGSITYSSVLGGSKDDAPYQGSSLDITDPVVGPSVVWLTGYTQSKDFPVTEGAYQTRYGGYRDAYVVAVSSDGAVLSYATYLGGGNKDEGTSIALDGSGQVYAVGYTSSKPFAVGTMRHRAGVDGYAAKFSPSGALLSSIYLGGGGRDTARGVEAFGTDVYVSGITGSDNFPTTSSAPHTTRSSDRNDAYLAVLTI